MGKGILWIITNLLEFMKENPDEKYIILLNGKDKLPLSSNNMIGLTDKEITIDGDYYHALDNDSLAISYNEIVNNLAWIEY